MTVWKLFTNPSSNSKRIIFVIFLIIIGMVHLPIYSNTVRYYWTCSGLKQKSLCYLPRNISTNGQQNISEYHVDQGTEKHKELSTKEVYNCSVIDFMARVDPTARTYNSDLVCDELSTKLDIICRMYLRQIGLEHQDTKICPIGDLGKVPRIVYYVIFGEYEFKFVHYVSFLSAKRFISPTAIYVIGDQHPKGKWWKEVLKNIHGVRFFYRELPGNISSLTPMSLHHLSDIVRLQSLYMNGGIYLDADMVVLKDPGPLLDYDITMGLIDNATGMGNAFIVVKRNNTFLRDWYAEYRRYKNGAGYFYWNSLKLPRNMWHRNSSRVHMEKVYKPNWYEHKMFNSSDYPWQNNYAVHIWGSIPNQPTSPQQIDKSNTTLAQIMRLALYGDSKIREQD